MSVDPLAEAPLNIGWSPYTYVWNNPLSNIDPDGRHGQGVETDYKNATTGEVVHVNDGINQTVEISDEYWSFVNNLSNNGIRSPYSEMMNHILLGQSSHISNTSISFTGNDLSNAQAYQRTNNNSSSRDDCLTTVCRLLPRIYPGANLNLSTAMTMDLPGNAEGNNMNKTMQHLINIGRASTQLEFNRSDNGSYANIALSLSNNTALNSTSAWGVSLSNSYHSLMAYATRTSSGTTYSLVDQFSFSTFTSAASFNQAVQNSFHGNYRNHRTVFTQLIK